jgi:hypothetical protein
MWTFLLESVVSNVSKMQKIPADLLHLNLIGFWTFADIVISSNS